MLSALVVGVISFAAGLLIPLFSSASTLGPLLGILVTGPIGTAIGALLGIVTSVREATEPELKSLARWLFYLWLAALGYTLLAIKLSPRLGAPAVALQALMIVATVWFLSGRDVPKAYQRSRFVIVLAMAVVALTAAFPLASGRDGSATIAFILDRRFDASRHVPLLTVRMGVLVLEWLIAVNIAAAVTALRARSQAGGSE
jgi:hypothetical protein